MEYENNQVLVSCIKFIDTIQVAYSDKILCEEDISLFKFCLKLQTGLLGDLQRGDSDALRAWSSYIHVGKIDVVGFAKTMKWAAQVITEASDNSLRNNYDWPPTPDCHLDLRGFKRLVRDQSLIWGCLAPIRHQIENYFQSPNWQDLREIRQWCLLTSRLNFRSLDLKSESELKYIAFESSLEGISYPSDLVQGIHDVIFEWCHDAHVDYSLGQHGPGSVSQTHGGRFPPAMKNSLFCSDLRIHHLVCQRSSLAGLDLFQRDGLDRTSEIVCVPKDMLRNRVISREPASLQWLQQAVKNSLSNHFDVHPVIRRIISLQDQNKSQDLARMGSIRGEYGTIDLTDASDSVTLTLVRAVFAGCSIWCDLFCTRSTHTILPSGKKICLRKFAPMGSAVCFPVECLIFAAICEYASRQVTGHRTTDKGIVLYRVYGDDIIVHHSIADLVMSYLDQLHFTVNQDKTFIFQGLHNFREACGGEYLDGYDVCPSRISRWLHYDHAATISSVEAVASFCGLLNRLYQQGLYNCRRVAFYTARQAFDRFLLLPFSTDNQNELTNVGLSEITPTILTFPDSCTRWRHLKRWNRHLQRTEYFALVPISVKDHKLLGEYCKKLHIRPEEYDTLKLTEYWLRLLRGDGDPTIEFGVPIAAETVVSTPMRLEWRMKWLPYYG